MGWTSDSKQPLVVMFLSTSRWRTSSIKTTASFRTKGIFSPFLLPPLSFFQSPNKQTLPQEKIRPLTSLDHPQSPFYDPEGGAITPVARVIVERIARKVSGFMLDHLCGCWIISRNALDPDADVGIHIKAAIKVLDSDTVTAEPSLSSFFCLV